MNDLPPTPRCGRYLAKSSEDIRRYYFLETVLGAIADKLGAVYP